MNGIILPLTPKRRDIIVRDRFGFLIRSFFQYRYASIGIHDWHVQSVVKDRDGTRLSGAFRKEPQWRISDESPNAKPCVLETFPTYRWALVVSTEASHRIHTEISTVKRNGMCDLWSQIGTRLLAKTVPRGAFWAQTAICDLRSGAKNPQTWQTAGTRRVESQKTCQKTNLEFLLKEPFGNSIPESLLSQIQAPWPELIEGVSLLTHLMLNERRELHKNAQQATHLLSIHCLYQTPAGSARGFVKKVNGADSGGAFGQLRTWLQAAFWRFGALWGSALQAAKRMGSLPSVPLFSPN